MFSILFGLIKNSEHNEYLIRLINNFDHHSLISDHTISDSI